MFETGDERYTWLNAVQAVGAGGHRRPQRHLRRVPAAVEVPGVAVPRAAIRTGRWRPGSRPCRDRRAGRRRRRCPSLVGARGGVDAAGGEEVPERATPAGGLPRVGYPGVGFSGMRFTWGASGRAGRGRPARRRRSSRSLTPSISAHSSSAAVPWPRGIAQPRQSGVQRVAPVDRDQLVAQLVVGGVQRDGQVDRQRGAGQAVDPGTSRRWRR